MKAREKNMIGACLNEDGKRRVEKWMRHSKLLEKDTAATAATFEKERVKRARENLYTSGMKAITRQVKTMRGEK